VICPVGSDTVHRPHRQTVKNKIKTGDRKALCKPWLFTEAKAVGIQLDGSGACAFCGGDDFWEVVPDRRFSAGKLDEFAALVDKETEVFR
jgi:hypothetical protein